MGKQVERRLGPAMVMWFVRSNRTPDRSGLI